MAIERMIGSNLATQDIAVYIGAEQDQAGYVQLEFSRSTLDFEYPTAVGVALTAKDAVDLATRLLKAAQHDLPQFLQER